MVEIRRFEFGAWEKDSISCDLLKRFSMLRNRARDLPARLPAEECLLKRAFFANA
jgi:hypothetical protein